MFAEGLTGEDGVFKQSLKELHDAADVRVLGLADGGVASNIVSLQGIGVAQGLADKAYIYTDRPVYRAGDLVHIRGVLHGPLTTITRSKPARNSRSKFSTPAAVRFGKRNWRYRNSAVSIRT